MQKVEQSADFRIPTVRQGTVKTFSVQMCFFCNCLHAAVCFGNIAQSQQESFPFSLFNCRIQVCRRFLRIFQGFNQIFLVISLLSHELSSLHGLEGMWLPSQYPIAVYSCLHLSTEVSTGCHPCRNRRGIPVRDQSVIPIHPFQYAYDLPNCLVAPYQAGHVFYPSIYVPQFFKPFFERLEAICSLIVINFVWERLHGKILAYKLR